MQLSLLLISLLHFFSLAVTTPIPASADSALAAHGTSASSVANYILIFEDGADTPDSVLQNLQTQLKSLGAKINYEYHTIIKGFSLTLDQSLVSKLPSLNDEKYPFIIEQDKEVHAS